MRKGWVRGGKSPRPCWFEAQKRRLAGLELKKDGSKITNPIMSEWRRIRGSPPCSPLPCGRPRIRRNERVIGLVIFEPSFFWLQTSKPSLLGFKPAWAGASPPAPTPFASAPSRAATHISAVHELRSPAHLEVARRTRKQQRGSNRSKQSIQAARRAKAKNWAVRAHKPGRTGRNAPISKPNGS